MTPVDVAVAGTHLRVWTEGSGRPLVYLHGFDEHPGPAAFLTSWAGSRRVCAPEHPGYGGSGPIEDVVDVVDLVLIYRSLLESQFDEPVDLVGHCLGGMFAAELAALCPQLVRRLVLVCPYGLWLDDHPLPDVFTMTDTQLRESRWHDPEAAALAVKRTAHVSGIEASLERARGLAAATKFMWPLPDRGLRRRLPFITSPTLVLHGASDRLVTRPYADEFVRLIPNAELRVIDDAAHLPMLEREAQFHAQVDPFLG